MEWYVALAVMIGLILTLMGVGVPVAFAFFATNIVGIYLFMGGGLGIRQMVANFGEAVSIYALTPLPLFLIMGSLFFRSGLGDNVFHAIDLCIGRVRARLSYIVVLAGAVFAALSGSSIAKTGMMGSAMVPEMLKRGGIFGSACSGYQRASSISPGCGTISPATQRAVKATIRLCGNGQLWLP